MIDPANEVKLTRVLMDDVDLFSEWQIDQGWDVGSTQLTAGANEIKFDHFAFPELVVVHYTSRQSMQNFFSVPAGTVVFPICRAKLPVFWNGRNLPPTLMGILRSGSEHWAVLPKGWDCYEFIMTEEFIRRTEIFPKDFLAATTRPECAYLPLMEPATSHFLERIDSFFHHHRGIIKNPRIAADGKQCVDFMIHGLLQVVDAGLKALGSYRPKSARRPDVVRKAMEFLADSLSAKLSIDDLVQTLGVSDRVLSYAFRDTLGISPYQYVLIEKLHAVRRLLKSGDVSVTEASLLYGYATPSRFARQYSRLFGELPSATRYPNRRRVSVV